MKVTENDIDKVKETLSKVVTSKDYLRYDRIYVYILKERQKKYSKKALQEITSGHFDFDPDEKIIDYHNLISRIKDLDYPLIQRIEETLEIHFSNPARYFIRPNVLPKPEKLTLNILPISFPKELFIGQVGYDRNDVIDQSRENGFFLSRRCSERGIVWAALNLKGLRFSCDWVVRSGEIISFNDLRDDTLPLVALVESADPKPIDEYLHDDEGNLDIDHLNIFKELLRVTFQAQLAHRGIKWQHRERKFIFVGSKEKGIRKEAWSQGKEEGRVVYRKVLRKDDPSKTKYHEHLAFEVSFDHYENQWFLAIKPDWFCSYDGYNRSFYNRNRVSFLKRNDHNDAVLDDLLYITEILKKDQKEMLAEEASRRFITLGDLVTLDGSPPINDDDWLQQDEKRKRKALEAKELPLFSYEPRSNT